MSSESFERRGNQRFVTHGHGRPRFWLSWPAGRVVVYDLSVEGFAISASTPPDGERPFEFRLERDGDRASVAGRAQVVNFVHSVNGGQAGCRFIGLEAAARCTIAGWLAEHVVEVSALPVRPEEAESIVLGPSIV